MQGHRYWKERGMMLGVCLTILTALLTAASSQIPVPLEARNQRPRGKREPLEMSSPKAALRALLEAMQRRDESSLKRLTTEEGLHSLDTCVSEGANRLNAFQELGKIWSQMNTVHWMKRRKDKVIVSLGNAPAEHFLTFRKTKEGWKLHGFEVGI